MCCSLNFQKLNIPALPPKPSCPFRFLIPKVTTVSTSPQISFVHLCSWKWHRTPCVFSLSECFCSRVCEIHPVVVNGLVALWYVLLCVCTTVHSSTKCRCTPKLFSVFCCYEESCEHPTTCLLLNTYSISVEWIPRGGIAASFQL